MRGLCHPFEAPYCAQYIARFLSWEWLCRCWLQVNETVSMLCGRGVDCLSCRGACGCHVTRTAGMQRYWRSNCSCTVFCCIGSHTGSLILAWKRYELGHGRRAYAHIKLSRCYKRCAVLPAAHCTGSLWPLI